MRKTETGMEIYKMISRYSTDGRKARGKYGQKSGLFRKKGGGRAGDKR